LPSAREPMRVLTTSAQSIHVSGLEHHAVQRQRDVPSSTNRTRTKGAADPSWSPPQSAAVVEDDDDDDDAS
jgi:hypothetical protein